MDRLIENRYIGQYNGQFDDRFDLPGLQEALNASIRDIEQMEEIKKSSLRYDMQLRELEQEYLDKQRILDLEKLKSIERAKEIIESKKTKRFEQLKNLKMELVRRFSCNEENRIKINNSIESYCDCTSDAIYFEMADESIYQELISFIQNPKSGKLVKELLPILDDIVQLIIPENEVGTDSDYEYDED